MVYAVVAAEGIYQGYHGIEQKGIIEVSSLEEAHEIAAEMSIEIMNSFVYNELEEEIQNEITIEWTDEEKIKNKSYEELKKELHSNFEEFLIKYQKIDD